MQVGLTRAADIAGVVGIAGPYDFLPITDPDIIAAVFATVDDGPASQPITYVDGRNPPMLLLAARRTPPSCRATPRRWPARSPPRVRPVESKLYPGIGHIGLITAFAPLFSLAGAQWRTMCGASSSSTARRGLPPGRLTLDPGVRLG